MIFDEFHEPLPLGSGFSCIVSEQPDEHWTDEAIAGLIGRMPTVTTPSGIQGIYEISAARRREDGFIEITAVPISEPQEERE